MNLKPPKFQLLALILVLPIWSSVPAAESPSGTEAESMYSLFVTMRVQPDSIEVFKQTLMDVAVGSNAESDCYRYDVLADQSDSTVFYIYEVFRDRDAHRRHTRTAHFKKWLIQGAPLLDGSMDVRYMETLFPSVQGYESQKPATSTWSDR